MTREKMIEAIKQFIMDGIDMECDCLGKIVYQSKMAKNIISLFEKAGWKAPDAPDPEKEALIQKNLRLIEEIFKIRERNFDLEE